MEVKNFKSVFLLGITLILISSCSSDSIEILKNVLPQYNNFPFKVKTFESNMWVQPRLLIYRGEMDFEQYKTIINDSERVPNCKEFTGKYEDMSVHYFTFDPSAIEWWKPMLNAKQDFVGHYDHELKKFTSCQESREYRYAFKYEDGYCYLIIENTLSKEL